MMKRFKKLLSAICVIALLISSIATVFANGDPDMDASAYQESAVEVNAIENNESEKTAAEETLAQGNDPVTEETSVQQNASVAEETPAQENDSAAEEAPAQENDSAMEETPAQENTPAAEEAPAQETAPTVEGVPVQETVPAAEAAQVQDAAPVIEEAPAQASAPAVEEIPAQGKAPAEEEVPVQNNADNTDAAPAQNEEPAADTAPAQEDTDVLNAAPVQEDVFAAVDNAKSNEESVVDTDTTPDDYDELANEPVNFREEDLVELDDNGGYMDPEYLEEEIGEITPEMKYTNISEMKIGSTVSGTAGADEIFFYIKADRTQNIILVLQEIGSIRVRINEHDVNFIEDEDGTKTYEMKVQSGSTYIIGISGNGSFKLTSEVKAVEEIAEEHEEESAAADDEIIENTETAAEDNTEAEDGADAEEDNADTEIGTEDKTEDDANTETLNSEEGTESPEETAETAETAVEETEETEQTIVEDTENAQETSEGTVESNAQDTTEDTEESFEGNEPAVATWVTVAVNEDGTVTVYANADIELDNQIVWQTRSADSNEWKKVGYGLKLTVEVTEENANNFFRFKWVDGDFSPEYQIHAITDTAEEESKDTAEDISEEAETTEDTEEDFEGKEIDEENAATEEEISSEENDNTIEETVSEEEGKVADETEEIPAETEEASDEAELTDDEASTKEDATENAESEETEENADAESEEEDEALEETEEEKEEAESLTEEQLIEQGYRKIEILNQNGTDIYDSTAEGATVIGNAETGTELWIKDAEAEGWAEVYAEDDVRKFIKLADIEKQPVTEEQLIELGYRKIEILNQNGTNIYDSTTEEAAVIDNAETGTELWIKDAEAEGWAEIYSEAEVQKFLKLAEIEKQPLTDEEMLNMNYIKAAIAYDVGANIYDSIYKGNVIDHLDADNEIWIKLIDDADYAEIYNDDPDTETRYIALVDVIAILKPEDMEQLPTRELAIHSSAEGMEILYYGTIIRFDTELINFLEDDEYTIQWKYSLDGEDYIDIDGANELSYEFELDKENIEYFWKISVILQTVEQ